MPHVGVFGRLGVRSVVLSGGEALLHSNLWTLCELLKEQGVRITLLSTGLSLERHAQPVVLWCDEVIVSLDGSRSLHDRIRRIPGVFDRLAAGVRALRRIGTDIGRVVDAGLGLCNLFTEPIATGDIIDRFFPQKSVGGGAAPAVHYDLRTRHGAVFGSPVPGYARSRRQVMDDLGAWLADAR